MENKVRSEISKKLVHECEQSRVHLNAFIGTCKQTLDNLDHNSEDLIRLHNHLIEMTLTMTEIQEQYRKKVDHVLANKALKKLVRFDEIVRIKSID